MESQPSENDGEKSIVVRIRSLLKQKDDTSRFVGLALLKTHLDNTPADREDVATLESLWAAISPKFLERLMRAAGKGDSTTPRQDRKDMLDLSVSVLHTFAVLLPDETKRKANFLNRIPLLVSSILYSSDETTKLILQILLTLSGFPEGASVIVDVEDLSPLFESAVKNSEALQILEYSWLNSMTTTKDKNQLQSSIDSGIRSLVSSFKGTDGVTLLEMLAHFFRHADPSILPPNPKWLKGLINFIRNLTVSRPTPEARSAYTNLAASLLQVFPLDAPALLFAAEPTGDKPFSYLLLNLVLIDVRSSCPSLLQKLNTPGYEAIARRLSSAFDIVTSFIGYLVRSMEGEDDGPLVFVIEPDLLLKLRKSITETMSVTVEYLRDRWDASVAGAMGLHVDARPAKAETSEGSRLTIAWDSMSDRADEDAFILSAVRALALWVREDDNESLRNEVVGLTDMLLELYQSKPSNELDFKSAILVALEGLADSNKGILAFLEHKGWATLAKDLSGILQHISKEADSQAAASGVEIIRVLLPVVEAESGGIPEEWMGFITTAAAWDAPDADQGSPIQELEVAVVQLCSALLLNASVGMRKRYVHSTAAIAGIGSQILSRLDDGSELRELLVDAMAVIQSVR